MALIRNIRKNYNNRDLTENEHGEGRKFRGLLSIDLMEVIYLSSKMLWAEGFIFKSSISCNQFGRKNYKIYRKLIFF